MTKKFPLNPAHPERICWGCDRYCPVDDMVCGNGSVATLHPAELFGSDWAGWLPGGVANNPTGPMTRSPVENSAYPADLSHEGAGA